VRRAPRWSRVQPAANDETAARTGVEVGEMFTKTYPSTEAERVASNPPGRTGASTTRRGGR
jgi:hypothetical protein